ncbi:hypothetical protein BC939DRAFT_499018 [Gamsiella multidivaricata]|uniref:uncharacterized protein n=1 Tax=Gamsiella multidivaricata TaxID=101098 RepID=UPI00221F4D89|nr:uncharacterized protein BC939DRAFT_499018 [Gamsiella multidivaricata]KAG0371020.1 hypothetical protein BGZ54_001374 [Gamsiella multidivaricata]KAI7831582.1 hypothetical protein BC939DRAFT_499018 [Gamsiella multidivaricata]
MASNRIVTSTIIRPETDSRDSRRKRSFPDAPEPARRRSNIASRLGDPSSSTFTTTTDSAELPRRLSTSGSTEHDITTETPATTGTQDPTSDNTHDSTMDTDVNSEDRTKRPRPSLQPVEDAKRGRRMMGMILGTLSQFKKQESSSVGEGRSSGMASREALQERVREKLRREQALNEELRRKEREEREERLKKQQQQQAIRSVGGARTNQRRGDAKWENGYILTDTRPRLRYMPKVMNDATREKFASQNRGQRQGHPGSSSLPATESAMEPAPEADSTGVVVDTEDVFMDSAKDGEGNKEDESPVSSAIVKSSPTETRDKSFMDVDLADGTDTKSKVDVADNAENTGDKTKKDDLINISLV